MKLRQAIIDEVELLADPKKQLQYEIDVPLADVPAELICGFCDDLYHPESSELGAQFTKAELAKLDKLYDILCQVADLKPSSVRELQAHTSWQVVVSNAKELYAYLSRST